MPGREAFDAALERVCERNGWGHSADLIEVKFEESGRHQKVRLAFFDFEGREFVRFFTTIGSATRIDPMRLTQGLRVSFGLPHGALALKKDELVMVDTLLLDHADETEVESVLRYLAETADHLESTMFGGDDN
jgi:hypothetical protein